MQRVATLQFFAFRLRMEVFTLFAEQIGAKSLGVFIETAAKEYAT